MVPVNIYISLSASKDYLCRANLKPINAAHFDIYKPAGNDDRDK